MRIKELFGMKWTLALVVLLSTVGGIAAALGWIGREDEGRPEVVAGGVVSEPVDASGSDTLSPLERLERKLVVKEESKKAVGEFTLTGGRKLRVHTADLENGQSCMIEEGPAVGVAATCLEEGLFAVRKVAFLVSSDGGPERFTELHVVGVAAPGIGFVSLRKSDGNAVAMRLTHDRAFLFESSGAELERDVLPSEVRLFGPNGRLVEEVAIPALR